MTEEHLVNPEFPKVDDLVNEPKYFSEILGMIETVTVAPSGNPTRLIDQIKIFNDSGTRKLRVYDCSNGTWYGVTLS